MEWVEACVAGLLVVVAFWGPGLVLLWAWRWGAAWVARWAVAPVLTLGLFGTAAIALDGLVRWNAATAAAVLAVAVGVLLAARRVSGTASSDGPPGSGPTVPRRLAPIVAAVVLVHLVAVAVALARPGRLLTAYDVIFHFNGIEHIRETGSASSFRFTAVYSLSDAPDGAFYGAAWHSVVALVPHVADASTTFNAALVVPTVVVWTIGIVFLTSVALPARPRAALWAAPLSVAGLGLPVYLGLSEQGLVANAFGVALVPALVALFPATAGMRLLPRAAMLMLAVLGVGLCHPNALLAALVVLSPAAVLRWGSVLTRGSSRLRFVGIGVLVAVVAGWWAMSRTDSYLRVAGVSGVEGDAPLPVGIALLQVIAGNGTFEGSAAGAVVGVGALVGCIVGRRLRQPRWAFLGCVASVLWYLMATSSLPVLRDVDVAWYGEPHRFAPVVAACLVPPAALALDSSWRRLRLLMVRANRPGLVAAGLLTALVGVPVVQTVVGTMDIVSIAYRGSGPRGAVADDDELAMMRRLPAAIALRGAVLGSPFAGASHLYGLRGIETVPRSWHTLMTPTLRYVTDHLADLGHDNELCSGLRDLGVAYLYVDSDPWNRRKAVTDVAQAPADGVRLVDSGGSAAIYEITACG